MAVETSSPPKRNIVAFLIRFAGTLFIAALIVWELFAPRTSAALPELQAADRALAAKNDKQARRQFEKLIGQEPQEPGIYEAVMSVCLAHGRADMGLEYGQRAIDACKYAPNEARAGLYLGLSEVYTLGREAPPQLKAQQYAQRALELAPDNPNALNGYGYVLADNARTEQEVNIAFGYIQKALLPLRAQTDVAPLTLAQVEDSYGWALYKRGTYKPGDYARAADALHQAIDDLPPETPGAMQKECYYHLGAACRAAGRIEEARHALQVALFYDPKFPEALRELQTLPPASPSLLPPAPAAPSVSTQTADGKPLFQPLPKKR